MDGIATPDGWLAGYRTVMGLIEQSRDGNDGAPDYVRVRIAIASLSARIQEAWTMAAESESEGMAAAAARGMTQLWVAERILDALERVSALDQDSIPLLPEPVRDLWEQQCEEAWQDVFERRDVAPMLAHCARWESLITAWLQMVESVSLLSSPPLEKPRRRRWLR